MSEDKLSREDLQVALERIRNAMHDQFPDAVARLEQLDSHMATVAMVVDHIHEEADRAAPGG